MGSFWLHFGIILGSNFGSIFEVRFQALLCRFGRPFWVHVGLQNHSRRHPGAKRSTLDFKQLSNENQRISNRILIQFWLHSGLIFAPFWHTFVVAFRIDFRGAFSSTCRFGRPCWVHFDLQNHSRRHPDAKRSNLDFEQPSNENHGFSGFRAYKKHEKNDSESESNIEL